MISTTPTKIPVSSMTLQRAEGPTASDFRPHTVPDYATADTLLRTWAWSAPEEGGYDKCDFTVTFADGQTYRGCYALKHPDVEAPDLRRHIQEFLLSHSRRYCPAWRSWDQHRAILARLDDAFITQCETWLDQYDI